MALQINLRRSVHRKSPEYLAPLRANTATGGFMVGDKSDVISLYHEHIFYIGGVSSIFRYVPDENGWLQLPNSGVAGTFGAGSCGSFRGLSAPAGNIYVTATAGGTTTKCNTNLTFRENPIGLRFVITEGAGAGLDTTIKNVTLGANSVIELNAAAGAAMDATTKFKIYGGSIWFFNAGTGTVGFGVYDILTGAWTQKSVTGLPTTWGTDGQLVKTPSGSSNDTQGFENGTSTGTNTSTTLNDTTKDWTKVNWANYQVSIISGLGAGQIRKISSNTGTGFTVSVAWTVTPDATSVYRIEGDDDTFYLLGNTSTNMYKYSISGNSWSTLAPTAARASAIGAGGTADWIDGVPEWDIASNEGEFFYTNTLRKQNGRYIYSFRGGATNTLDVYDISSNTWVSGVLYGNQNETFTGGTSATDIDGKIYIMKEATGLYFCFDVNRNVLLPFETSPVVQGTAVNGNKMMFSTYRDGSQKIKYLYSLSHTTNIFIRYLII